MNFDSRKVLSLLSVFKWDAIVEAQAIRNKNHSFAVMTNDMIFTNQLYASGNPTLYLSTKVYNFAAADLDLTSNIKIEEKSSTKKNSKSDSTSTSLSKCSSDYVLLEKYQKFISNMSEF